MGVIASQTVLNRFIASVKDKSQIKHFKVEDLKDDCDCLACLYFTF